MGNKLTLSLAAASVVALFMVGCGGGSSSSSTVPYVDVQKGPVFFATVQDKNGQVGTPAVKTLDEAASAAGVARYTFATTPVYPICAKGSEFSWVDADESGDVNTGDTMLKQDFCTYSGTIINAYTDAAVKAAGSATEYEAILAQMATQLGVTKADLLKAPSEMSGKVLATVAALYAQSLLDPTFNANNSNVSEASSFDGTLASVLATNSNDSAAVEGDMFDALPASMKPSVNMAALEAKLTELNANNSNESNSNESEVIENPLADALAYGKRITFTDSPTESTTISFHTNGTTTEISTNGDSESGTWSYTNGIYRIAYGTNDYVEFSLSSIAVGTVVSGTDHYQGDVDTFTTVIASVSNL